MQNRDSLQSTRQVTFEGLRAGEGYFSANGSQMVFQSERRDSNPFFQIYLLDLSFGDVTPVSPGHGKTTCAWIHPQNNKILFASTQDDPEAKQKQRAELEFRESGQSRRYSWDYDPHYEMYAFDKTTKAYTRLTNTEGYDAEGSYSPDGKLIAFASNRRAYSEAMSEEQRKAFELDPAFMMDIYVMDADGTNVRQLTDVPGYDGGPFFSPDGQRICWRRFAENGATAEVMTMNIDGSDPKRLTNIRAMSWAPFYHPSGQYLIFTTNKHGFANFELYLIDTEAQSEPVRITYTAGFDGLASFSPDGKQLTWTSNRNDKKQSQIYLADWNHEQALKALGLSKSNVEESVAAEQGAQSALETTFDFTDRDMVRHVDYLCRAELGGRMTGSLGEKQATAYVAAYLDSLGVEPAGDNGSWFQTFEFPAGAQLGPKNALVAELQENASTQVANYDVANQWQPLSFSSTGPSEQAPVVFAGYGILAEEEDGQPAYDSYAGLNVKDKWVMILRYLPEDVDDKRREFLARQTQLRKKAMVARDKGARGVIFVSGPQSNVKQQLVPLKNDFTEAGSSIAAISITDELAQQWLQRGDRNLQQLQIEWDRGAQLAGFELPGVVLSATVDVTQLVGQGRNVVGRLMVAETASKQAIIVGAHIDHLGNGTSGSLARQEERGQIHVGADDNASGVAAMLEIAQFLSGLKRNGRLDMQRDIVFAAWSGEELGLHGSQHFAKQRIPVSRRPKRKGQETGAYAGDPHDLNQVIRYYEQLVGNFEPQAASASQLELLQSNMKDMQVVGKLLSSVAANDGGRNDEQITQLDQLRRKAVVLIEKATNAPKHDAAQGDDNVTPPFVACLNMDMVGRMKSKVVLQGIGSSTAWNRMIEKANVVVGLPIELSEDTQLPTDASSFYRAGVPILSAFTGSHTDYHTPRDTPEKLNYKDAARIAKIMGLIARQLVITPETPAYIARSATPQKRGTNTGRRARLGTVPNYTEKVAGVLLDDVERGGPAAEAGIAGGDIVIELNGKSIENIYDYQFAIDSLKVGRTTTVTVRRGEQEIQLKITPAPETDQTGIFS